MFTQIYLKITGLLLLIFFKSNSGYIVVGTFVIENDTTNNIAEALTQFQSWNHGVRPCHQLILLALGYYATSSMPIVMGDVDICPSHLYQERSAILQMRWTVRQAQMFITMPLLKNKKKCFS